MAITEVSHLTLTVSTIDVFVDTMKFIHENGLWDDAKAYLKSKGKTEVFVDYRVLFLFREMLERQGHPGRKGPVFEALIKHINPFDEYLEQTS
jgi:hypothetical protein